MSEILPCPFCNFAGIYDSSNGIENDFLECGDCGASGPVAMNADKAIAAWNTRAAAPSGAEPVAWQCREHGEVEWHDISREAFGINPSRYAYRELLTAPPATQDQIRDAARYRFLRDQAFGQNGALALLPPDKMDAAIDSALKSGAHGQGQSR